MHLRRTTCKKLLAYRPHRSTDNHCRLIFLLGCFTGLAFSDLKKLRMDDVYTLSDGRRYISLCRTKTQNRSIVPLLPVAEKILAIVSHGRREGLFFREFPSNSNFNRTIQEICIKAGLSPHTQATSQHRTAYLCHDHLSGERTSDRDGEQDAGASLYLHDRDLCTGDQEQDCQGNATPDG